LHGQVDIEIGTLSKAFGVIGGYVAGPQVLIDYLKQRGRPYLFSSATTAADVAACIAAVEILQQLDHAVQQLWENTRFFQAALRVVGFDLGRTQTPITPIRVGDAQRARTFSTELFTAGIFAPAVAFPTVPRGTARLRLMLSATHTREDLEFAVQTLARVGRACRVIA
jgi:glycine C-acetyltransferase